MNVEAFEHLLTNYQNRISELGRNSSSLVDNEDARFSLRSVPPPFRVGHMGTMIPQMFKMLKNGDEGKFYRWLGFMQGCFWFLGTYSLNELRSHNRGICGGGSCVCIDPLNQGHHILCVDYSEAE
jgi:hypothetical protein